MSAARNRRPRASLEIAEDRARALAEQQLMRVCWNEFGHAYEQYPEWLAFALWAEAIAERGGKYSSSLVTTLEHRCPSFLAGCDVLKAPELVFLELTEWIHSNVFACAQQHGWLDALVFFGFRHPYSKYAWMHRELCDDAWSENAPAVYPSFEEWWDEAQNRSTHEGVTGSQLARMTDKYVEWRAFRLWIEIWSRTNVTFPPRFRNELCERWSDFEQVEDPCLQQNAPPNWKSLQLVEDRIFAEPNNNGWFPALERNATSHPHYVRTARYADYFEVHCRQPRADNLPGFVEWLSCADAYVEE